MEGRLKFRKFEPAQNLVNYTQSRLARLHELLPEDAVSLATMTCENALFTFRVEIYSSSCQCIAEYETADSFASVDLVQQDLISQVTEIETKSLLKTSTLNWTSAFAPA